MEKDLSSEILNTDIKDIKITGTSSYIDILICGRTARIFGEMGIRCFNCYKGALSSWLIPENEPISADEKTAIIKKIKEKTNKSYMEILFEDDSAESENPVQQIEKFFITRLKTDFNNQKLKKIFFEIGEFWNEDDEECIDFHMIVVTEDEYNNLKVSYTEKYGKNEADELCNQSGEYMHEDDRNCIRFEQYDLIRNNCKTYEDALKMAEDVIKEFKLEKLADFELADDFTIFDLSQY